MQFTEITAEAFRKFAAKSPYFSFMQTPEIAQLRQKSGWTPHYFAVKKGKKILAASLVLSRPTFLGWQTFYAPGGPLLDLEDRELVNFFFQSLKTYAKSHHAYVLRISPYYELIERDREGEIVKNGFNHHSALGYLQHLGFRSLSRPSGTPQYLFALDLQGQTAETVLAGFSQNVRRSLRRAEKNGVRIRSAEKADLPLFKQITSSTATRRGFDDQPLSYYEQMFDLFHPRGEVEFLIAEADLNGHPTPLSVAMFMLVGHEIVYLYSGSVEAYMKQFTAQYLIQWHMLKFALAHGFDRFNFYGIQGLPDPAAKDYGVYNFKRGFGGHVIELIGTLELPLNPCIYRLHSVLSNLTHLLHR